ncbi:DUF6011 domain-containing protein [Streptomyces phaeochromogenes]|uniref:DUF6011 domain-containing protein n=1 Tax=Streptomyces phaeochromogenes TaxID=1923 RepID=UPI00367945CC
MTAHAETRVAGETTDAPACLLCGRPLADPASRALGFGPRCLKRVQSRLAIHGSRTRTPATPGAGQLALELDDEDEWGEPCGDGDPLDDLPRIPPDLGGQGLTSRQLMTMTDIPLTGSYL